ncbi:MAG: NAD+ synthase [Spirochaetes bacterium]|nr:NAD+ synthase [Spirochaetota bacterium]
MKIAMAQINPVVGDVEGNRRKILDSIGRAEKGGADLTVFPEMATIGYPPMDLLENPMLVAQNLKSIEAIARRTGEAAVICGFVDHDPVHQPMLRNCAAFMRGGRIVSRHPKTLLPFYDVFDETRYFCPAPEQVPAEHRGTSLGITVCEDIWNPLHLSDSRLMENRQYDTDPVKNLAERGIDVIVNISASPFVRGKHAAKRSMLSAMARQYRVPLVYVNQAGGNDSIIFDGRSMAFDGSGELIARAAGFGEDLLVFDTDSGGCGSCGADIAPDEGEMEEIRRALVLGIRDYLHKCGFSKAVIGLSGGIDSALTAALAVEALGKENVLGVTMPSVYSSKGSVDDSVALARNLGIEIYTVPIQGLFSQYLEVLGDLFRDLPADTTEENIQARIRGNILMAVSNKTGRILLTTGNKSELSVGYCTIYGDMCGGLAVISDLTKSNVYRLSRHINESGEVIPVETIEKPPSAELRPDQVDQDTLPPYEVLDRILELYIEEHRSSREIVAQGFDEALVARILQMVRVNEYKRMQAAPGLKVTAKAFGTGRRIPIAQRFRP